MKKTLKKYIAGIALVEVLVASSLISITTLAVIFSAQKGLTLSSRALHEVQAAYLLEEGAEAVKTIRDTNWTTISNLSLATNYYLSFDTITNTWSLSTTPNTIDSVFTRTIVLDSVYRDSNDDIASSGTLDTRTKKVTVNISWASSGGAQSKNISLYIADIFN